MVFLAYISYVSEGCTCVPFARALYAERITISEGPDKYRKTFAMNLYKGRGFDA